MEAIHIKWKNLATFDRADFKITSFAYQCFDQAIQPT